MAPSVPWQGPFQQSLISLNAISWGRGWANGPLRAHLFEAIILRRPLFGVKHCPHKLEDYAVFGGECIWLKDTKNWRRRMELISRKQTGDPQTSTRCTLMSTHDSGFRYSEEQVRTNQFLAERCNSEKEKQFREGRNWVSSIAFTVGQAFTSKWRLKNSKTPIICLLLHKGINTLDVPLWNKSLPGSDFSYVYTPQGKRLRWIHLKYLSDFRVYCL